MDPEQVNVWFEKTSREFKPIASRFAGQPITYVEIGCWAGACSEWVCRNGLTHPESRGFGIDPYWQHVQRRRNNMAQIKELAATRTHAAIGERFEWIYEPSETGLLTLRKRLNGAPIDLLYIDGDHEAPGVLSDFLLSWPMLRVGSIVIFDDYARQRKDVIWPNVREACASIELSFQWYIRPIHLHRQYAIEVVTKTLPPLRRRDKPPEGKWSNLVIQDIKLK